MSDDAVGGSRHTLTLVLHATRSKLEVSRFTLVKVGEVKGYTDEVGLRCIILLIIVIIDDELGTICSFDS